MSVNTIPMTGDNYPSGTAYLVLPSDITREKYITLCLRTGTVSVRTEDGAFYNRVPISRNLLGYLDFPEKISELGTSLVYINEPLRNQLFIIGALINTDEITDLVEGQFKISKRDSKTSSTVEVTGSAKKQSLSLIVSSEQLASRLDIRVINASKTSLLDIFVTGNINVQSTDKSSITSFTETEIKTQSTKDTEKVSSFRQTPTQQFFESEEYLFGKASEAALLGDTFKKEIEKMNLILETIEKIITSTPIAEPGNMAPSVFQQTLSAAISNLPRPDFSEILSKKIKIE